MMAMSLVSTAVASRWWSYAVTPALVVMHFAFVGIEAPQAPGPSTSRRGASDYLAEVRDLRRIERDALLLAAACGVVVGFLLALAIDWVAHLSSANKVVTALVAWPFLHCASMVAFEAATDGGIVRAGVPVPLRSLLVPGVGAWILWFAVLVLPV